MTVQPGVGGLWVLCSRNAPSTADPHTGRTAPGCPSVERVSPFWGSVPSACP